MKKIIIVIVILLAATLPFHYALDYQKVFLKDSLSFNYTFITKEDVNKLLDKYNKASFYEKLTIRGDYIFRKLMEQGIIFEENNKENNNSIDNNTTQEVY